MVHSYKSLPDEVTPLSAKIGNDDDTISPSLGRSTSSNASKRMFMFLGAWCGLLVFAGITPQSMVAFVSSSWNDRDLAANTISMCVDEMDLITKRPSNGATVECWDRDRNRDDFMARGATGPDGCLTLSYENKSWDGVLGGKSPDIYCTVNKSGFFQAVPKDLDQHDQSTAAVITDTVTLFRDRTNDDGTTNGCGPQVSKYVANSVFTYGVGFEDLCFQHGKCYWDCQVFNAIKSKDNLSDADAAVAAKEFCDREMYENTKSYCYFNNGNLQGIDEKGCLTRAWNVYKLVQEVGEYSASCQ